jgi:hypothetical protein
VTCPNVVVEYNKFMGCVDKADMLKSLWDWQKKQKVVAPPTVALHRHYNDQYLCLVQVVHYSYSCKGERGQPSRRNRKFSPNSSLTFLQRGDWINQNTYLFRVLQEDVLNVVQRLSPIAQNGNVQFVKFHCAWIEQRTALVLFTRRIK